MKSLSKKILLLLAASLDEVIDWEKTLTSPYMRIKFASYKDNYFQKIAQSMVKAGEIDRIIKRGQPFFRITSRGKVKLIYDVPLAKRLEKKWDGKWRMVIFDIPEITRVKREALRKKLKDLGFAQWQKSVYVTPFDVGQEIAEYLGAVNLGENAVMLEVKKIFVGDERQMANKLWHLGSINLKYKEFVEKFKGKKKKNGMQEEYLFILEEDPFLPKELLPDLWWGEEAKKLAGKF
ncbi:hypothetical protein HZB97_00975 [Candidatus Gottesmanbacteria bacterium]|nr:hypothetical protein [Candidatus Gottesmanbacteria bacterium]